MRLLRRDSAAFLLVLLVCGYCEGFAAPRADAGEAPAGAIAGESDLYLEVFVNGVSTGLIAAFRRRADGSFAVAPDELREVGLLPADEAVGADGLVSLDRLAGVAFDYDEAGQTMRFTVTGDARAARELDIGGAAADDAVVAQSGLGGVVNYTLFASAGGALLSDLTEFEGLSAAFDARLFSSWGTLSNSAIASTAMHEPYGSLRLDTTWSYSDPKRLLTYNAGDLISGGLAWTRPVRLGGLQVERSFRLRPDLVTLPLPSFSGSAAVPSTLDIYTSNGRIFSGFLPAGSFVANNLPVVSGAGTARVILTDALGRETVTDLPFYVGSSFLRQGLLDFSVEAGLPRRSYGAASFDYDEDWFASGSLRYGWRDWLTIEGHLEGGENLVNGGAGAVFPLGAWGAGSMALAGSTADADIGMQLSGSVEFDFGSVSLFGRTQRTLGDYQDIASVSASVSDLEAGETEPARALEQIALNFPLSFDSGSFSLGATHLESADGEENWIGTLSYSRPMPRNSALFASAFVDIEDDADFGGYLGFSMPLGSRTSANAGMESGRHGVAAFADVSRSGTLEPGSFGWRVRTSKGGGDDQAAGASYRSTFAQFEAGILHSSAGTHATAQMDGALVVAGGGIFAANRINDAFAVVDAGAPGVDVLYENRPVGTTNGSGRLIVPDLRSYEANKIAIDPTNLPVDAIVPLTEEIVVPADRSGVSVGFGVSTDLPSALVEFRDMEGAPIEAGSTGELAGGAGAFFVGYDGQAYVTGLDRHNVATITRTDGTTCIAEFEFAPEDGVQVQIPGAACLAQAREG